jgi:hypothetical protein
MAVTRETICLKDNFNRAHTYSTTPGHNGWTLEITGTTPTIANQNGGGVKLTLTSTSEAQICTLYQNDVLPIPLLGVQRMRFNALVGGVDSVTTLVMGLASAQNDAADSVATNAWFRMEGSASTTAIVVETDDGTTDNNDVATGATLAATSKEFIIDFTRGIADIRFFVDGAPVALATTFAMSAATSSTYVQPFFQIQKASGTGVATVTVGRVEIEYTKSLGA